MKQFIEKVSLMLIILICIKPLGATGNQFDQIYQFVTTIWDGRAPQLAFWIEDTSGNYLHTIYVTSKTGKDGIGSYRPSDLPVWAHRRVDAWGSGYPTTENPLPDTITSATPGPGVFTWNWTVPSTLAPGNYYYFIEANVSFVYNEYYTDWPNGEPSVVYRGSLKVDDESPNTTGVLIGHGHVSGANGIIATTMDSLTTALTITTNLSVNHYLAPKISTTSIADADVNSAYSAAIAFVDPNAGDSHTFSFLASPGWMSINSSGVISGTPGSGDAASDVPVTVRVVDSYGLADTLATTIDVIGASNSPPVISTTTLPDASEDQSYSATVSATDPDTDTVTFSLLTGPAWLSISTGGALSGTPTNGDVGTGIAVSVRGADPGGLADTLSTTIDVINANDPPVISTTTLPDATEDQAYSATVSASDPDTDTVTFSLLTGPAWLSISSGGALSGTPSNGDVGTGIAISVRAADPGGLADTLSTTIDVLNTNDAPVISTTTLPDAMEDNAYSATVSASDPDTDTVTFSLLTGPDWLSISAGGALSGTPANGDVETGIAVSVRAADPGGLADTLSTTIDVVNANDPPVISTTSLPDATEDQSYSATVSASDPDTDAVTFSLLTGPAWLSISAGGALSGTPANDDVGTNISVSVRAADPGGLADTLSTTIDVMNTNDAPVISTTTLPDAMEDQSYSATVSAADPDTDTVTFSLLTGPDWLSISAGGALSGTPENGDIGTDVAVSVRAADPGGLADTLSTTIDVLNTNDAPVISTTTLPDAMEDQPYSATVSAADPDADTVTFSLLTGPDWLSISAGGALSGTPENGDIGTDVAVSVRAADPGGLADTLSTTIDVVNANDPPAISTTSLPDATEDQTYSATVSASDPDTDTVTFSLLTGPDWLSISAGGALSGTPENGDVGTGIAVSVRAADPGGLADTLSTTIDVMNTNDPPQILTTVLPNGSQDIPYSALLDVLDPDVGEVLTFALLDGPGWMSIDAGTGELSGTPSPADIGTGIAVHVEVTDGDESDDASFTINVVDFNDGPEIVTAGLPDATENAAYAASIEATDADEHDTITYALLEGPDWLALDSVTGTLSGMPLNRHVGTGIRVRIIAADNGSPSLADTLATYIDVANTNDAPNIVTTVIDDAVVDIEYHDSIEAEDPDVGDVLTYAITQGPDWLAIDPSTGDLAGTPETGDAGSDISVTVRVTDAGDMSDEATFTIAVREQTAVQIEVSDLGGQFDVSNTPVLEEIGLEELVIEIPAGALDSQKDILIEIPVSTSDMGEPLQVIDFTVGGHEGRYDFGEPVVIRIPYPDNVENEELLTIKEWDPDARVWKTIELSVTIEIDTVRNLIIAQVTHFSIYGIVYNEPSTHVESTPTGIVLLPPYPNPCNSSTTFQFELPGEYPVRLSVFDILGREIAVLENGRFAGGVHTRTWNGKNKDNNTVSNGVYLYRFKAGRHISTGKLLYLK